MQLTSHAKTRHRFLVVGLLAALLGGLVVRTPWTGRVATSTFDLLHGPVFCGVAFVLMWLIPPETDRRHTAVRGLLAVGLLLFGAFGEFIQQFAGRHSTWHDLVANSMGVTAGWLFFEWWCRRRQRIGRIALITAAILLVAAVRPAMTNLIDCVRAAREFPQLDSFESGTIRWSTTSARCRALVDPQLATDGQQLLRLELLPGRYPGVHMPEPPRDWSGFEELRFDVRLADDSPVDSLTMIAKLQDEAHITQYDAQYEDRFHQEVVLERGRWQQVVVDLDEVRAAPETREMDLTRITFFQFYTIDLPQPVIVLLDNVRLVNP